MQLTLYYQPGTRAQRVRWTLEELGLDYQLKYIDLFAGDGNSAEYRRIHPLGQLPALQVDDEVMIESGAIVQWLAEAHIEKGLAAAQDSPSRREFLQWMYFAVTSLEGPAWEVVLHGKILPENLAVKPIIAFAMQRLEQVLGVLERVLSERDYLVGNHFTVADIQVGYILMWFNDQIESYPGLQAYLNRLTQRPAYQRSKVD